MAGEAEVAEATTADVESAPAEQTPTENSGPAFPFESREDPVTNADETVSRSQALSEDDGPPTGEGDTEAPNTPAVKAAPAKPLMTPLLIAQAIKAGMEPDEIQDWGDDAKGLERAIKTISRYSAAQPKKDSGEQHADERQVDDIPDLDPKEYDEPIVKGWTAMKSTIKRQEQALQQLHGFMQQRENEGWNEWFDGQIGALGDESAATFGKGRGTSMDSKSGEFQNRSKLWGALQTIIGGFKSRNESMPPRNELFKQAHRLAFGDNIEKSARQKIAANLTTRRKSFTQPPSQRQGANSLSATHRAEAKVEEILKANSR